MNKELKDYTTQELFNELYNREDVVALKLWTIKDVRDKVDDVLMNDFPEMLPYVEELKDEVAEDDYSYLDDCTDQEWDSIYVSVYNTVKNFKEQMENHD